MMCNEVMVPVTGSKIMFLFIHNFTDAFGSLIYLVFSHFPGIVIMVFVIISISFFPTLVSSLQVITLSLRHLCAAQGHSSLFRPHLLARLIACAIPIVLGGRTAIRSQKLLIWLSMPKKNIYFLQTGELSLIIIEFKTRINSLEKYICSQFVVLFSIKYIHTNHR